MAGEYVLAGLQGLTNGLVEGLKYRQQQDLQNKQLQMQQEHQDLTNKVLQNQLDADAKNKELDDPNSKATLLKKNALKLGLESMINSGALKNNSPNVKTFLDAANDPNVTGRQILELSSDPNFKYITSLGESKQKGDSFGMLGQARMLGVQNAQDRTAASAGDHFYNDKILQKITQQKQQIALDKHTLESSGGSLTPGIINEIQQGIANAISGGGSAGLGKTEQIEVQNANQRIAKIKEKFTSGVQVINDPELVKYFHDVLDRLDTAYTNNGKARALSIFQTKSKAYLHNPAAIEVLKDGLSQWTGEASHNAAASTNTPMVSPSATPIPVDTDLSKLTPEGLQQYIETHGK